MPILSLLRYGLLSHSHLVREHLFLLPWIVTSQMLSCNHRSVTEGLRWAAQQEEMEVWTICNPLRQPGIWEKQEVAFKKICTQLKKHIYVGKTIWVHTPVIAKYQRREIFPVILQLNLFLSFLLQKSSILPSKYSIKKKNKTTRKKGNQGSFRYLVNRRYIVVIYC